MAMNGTKENPCESGFVLCDKAFPAGVRWTALRHKLPHGWIVRVGHGTTFVPFAAEGTGWGKSDPVPLCEVNDDHPS